MAHFHARFIRVIVILESDLKCSIVVGLHTHTLRREHLYRKLPSANILCNWHIEKRVYVICMFTIPAPPYSLLTQSPDKSGRMSISTGKNGFETLNFISWLTAFPRLTCYIAYYSPRGARPLFGRK